MSQSEDLQFYATTSFQCGYFKDREATYAVLKQSEKPPSTEVQTNLLNQGFRRSHDSLYRPYCEGCQDCIPCRLEVEKFIPSKSQRRCTKRNQHWHNKISEPIVTDEIAALYRSYITWKHAKNDDDDGKLDFLYCDWSQTKFILTRDTENILIAVTVVDLVLDGVSAVYNFYHPDSKYHRYSLGSYAILNEIMYVKSLKLPYLYLGYYLKNTPKMSYKIKYQPLEMFIDKHWVIP